MSALEWITIEGFKSIKSVQRLQLSNINVIIGANGSGKSNFIGAFAFLGAVREGRLKEYVARIGGANALLYLGSKQTETIRFQLSFDDERNGYSIDLLYNSADGLSPSHEHVSYWDKRLYGSSLDRPLQAKGDEAGISASTDAISQYVRNHLDRWRLYHFHDTSRTSPLKQVCDINDNRFLRSDGANLPAFLHRLRERHPNDYSLIVGTIRRVAPFFRDFVLEPSALNEEKIRLEWIHEGTDAYFSASSLSDGSIRFIALATLLLQPALLRPSVILIDEPELGLHPFALTVLASMVKQAATRTQVIISTQSALLLDHFEPENVLVADRVDNGTTFNRLTNEQVDEWLDEYSLGQLWEKAEFGGRPNASKGKSA